jgi:hypothetical protein
MRARSPRQGDRLGEREDKVGGGLSGRHGGDLAQATGASKGGCPGTFSLLPRSGLSVFVRCEGSVNFSELYRANAAECLVMASSMTDPNNRASLLDMAWNWQRLAEQAEKNGRLRETIAAPKK